MIFKEGSAFFCSEGVSTFLGKRGEDLTGAEFCCRDGVVGGREGFVVAVGRVSSSSSGIASAGSRYCVLWKSTVKGEVRGICRQGDQRTTVDRRSCDWSAYFIRQYGEFTEKLRLRLII